MDVGPSTTQDDSSCVLCPSGTFKSDSHTGNSTSCFLKSSLPTQCPQGQFISKGVSRTEDDVGCQPVDNCTAYKCLWKSAEAPCPVGEYFHLGNNATRNDWKCRKCAADMYKAVASHRHCSPRTSQCTSLMEELVETIDPSHDNLCRLPGRCDVRHA